MKEKEITGTQKMIGIVSGQKGSHRNASGRGHHTKSESGEVRREEPLLPLNTNLEGGLGPLK